MVCTTVVVAPGEGDRVLEVIVRVELEVSYDWVCDDMAVCE